MKYDLTLATKLGALFTNRGLMLASAESCTGGMVAEIITSVSGSSKWFDRGFITYSNESKIEMLDVSLETLKNFGAVSVETASEMAEGALKHSRAAISLATTGIAGPEGGTPDKPVGLACFAVARKGEKTIGWHKKFEGDRQAIRLRSSRYILEYLCDLF